MKIPKNIFVGPTFWTPNNKLYDYEQREITIEDINDDRDVARIEEEVDRRLERLRRDGKTWELDVVIVGSPIEARNTVIVFRSRRGND